MANKKRKRYSSVTRRKKELNVFHFIPLLFIIAIVPLIMRGTVINLSELEQSVWLGQEGRFDIFSFHKSIWFSLMTFASLFMLLWLHLEGYLKIRKALIYYIPLGIYGIYVFLSWVSSQDVGLATRGFIELFQGFFVLISYGIIIFVTMNMVRKEHHLNFYLYAFGIVGLVTFIIGFSQWFGFDVFRSTLVQRFILPNNLSHLVGNLNFTFGPQTIYATMYNTNFVGSFAALMVPLALVGFFYFEEEKFKVYSGIFFGMMVFVWFGSNSRAGLLGVFAALLLLSIFMYKSFLSQKKISLIVLGLIVGISLIMNIISGGQTLGQVSRLNPIVEAGETAPETTRLFFEEVTLDGFTLDMVADQSSLRIRFNPETSILSFSDLEGNELDTLISEGNITLTTPGYEMYRFVLDGPNGILRVFVNQRTLEVILTDMGFLLNLVGGVSNAIDVPPRVSLLDGREEFASQRGYIWSRSIPMLLDTLFVGHGPDMYVIYFPQRDVAGRLNGFILTGINDKPHNMFLQIGINTGVVSLLALMSVYGIYMLDSIKLFWKREYVSLQDYFGVGAFAAITGYLVAGIFNDQIISVAPLFYALTGLGIAINWLIKEDERLETGVPSKVN